MADKKISELPAAESLESTDLMMVAQENVSSSSGYVSMKTTAADVADEFNTELTYNDLNTTDKTIVGSINEVKGIAEGMVEANPAGSASTALDKIKIGNTTYEIEDTGSIVSVFQTLGTGTEIGSITVDNVETKLYAPTPTEVTANPQGVSSTDLEKISIGGSIYNIPSGGSSVGDLDDLGDVTLTSPTDGQVLKYDGTNQIWINAAESGGGSSTLAGLTDTNVFSPAADQDLSYDSTSSKWINKTHRVELTKAQYDALPSSKLTDGIEYFITDMETTGVEIVANPQDTATNTLTKLQIGDDIYSISGGVSASWTDITGTLTAGQTSITLSNGYISDNCTFDFYTSKFGVNPTDVSVSNGSITLTFDEQEENINVKVRLYDYIIPTFKNYAKFNGTGIVLPFEINSSYKIICDFYETTYQTGQCIVGDTYSESVSGILLYTDSNSYVIGHGGYSGINSIIASWSSGLHNIIVNNDSSQCVLDNTNTESFTPTTLSNYYYTVGCKVNANTRPYYGYIKEYKIESLLTGDVICDLKPAIVNNNACLFDIITGDIYTATNMTVIDIIPSE